MSFIAQVGFTHGFYSYGHYLRDHLPTNNGVDYEVVLEAGCGGDFTDEPATTAAAQARFATWAADNFEQLLERADEGAAAERGERGKKRRRVNRPKRSDAFEVTPAARDGRAMLDFLLGPEP